MNETLEAMARALFKDWFVDFGPTRTKMAMRGEDPQKENVAREPYLAPEIWNLFPDRLDADGKPEGWGVTQIGSIAEQIAMGPFGSNIKVETFVEFGVPVISGGHLKGTRLDDGEFNFITEEHAARLTRSNVQRGDVIFTHAGNIGQVAIIPETSAYDRYIISQRQFYLRCNQEKMSPLFIVYFFKSPDGQHKLLANASQVGVPSIAKPATYLKSIEIRLPSRAVLTEFDSIVGALHLKAGHNELENKGLSLTRDLLLPKLMSGEVRVAAAEKVIEEVA